MGTEFPASIRVKHGAFFQLSKFWESKHTQTQRERDGDFSGCVKRLPRPDHFEQMPGRSGYQKSRLSVACPIIYYSVLCRIQAALFRITNDL